MTTDTRQSGGDPTPEHRRATPEAAGQAPFAPTLALTVTLAFAAIAIVIGVVLIVDRPTALGPVLPAQNQDAETLLYLLSFLVILPLAILGGARLADRIAAGPNAAGLSLLSGVLALTLSADDPADPALRHASLGRRGRCGSRGRGDLVGAGRGAPGDGPCDPPPGALSSAIRDWRDRHGC